MLWHALRLATTSYCGCAAANACACLCSDSCPMDTGGILNPVLHKGFLLMVVKHKADTSILPPAHRPHTHPSHLPLSLPLHSLVYTAQEDC